MKLCSSSTLPILHFSLFHCCVTLLKEKLPVEEELHVSVPICMGRSIWPCLSICFWCKLVTEKLVGVICDNVNDKMQYSCLQAVEQKGISDTNSSKRFLIFSCTHTLSSNALVVLGLKITTIYVIVCI